MARILITGASAGIGKAAAILLANKGHTVIATARSRDALEDLASRFDSMYALPMDVTDPDSVNAAVSEASRLLQGEALDILVNNAGFGCAGPLEFLEDEDFARQYATNVFGLVRVIRAFLPAMRERGRGRIINVSSVAGQVTMPFFSAYASTKHAVESISDALRLELRPHGVDVVLIEPGAVKTGFGEHEREQLQRRAGQSPAYREQLEVFMRFHRRLHAAGADPVTVAGAVVKACEAQRPRPRYVTPRGRNHLFLLLDRLLPTAVADWLMARITGLNRAWPG
jgi:NAD(P)-dependent dehydrogenase (short-subunit alcohol dehydrogenase family)